MVRPKTHLSERADLQNYESCIFNYLKKRELENQLKEILASKVVFIPRFKTDIDWQSGISKAVFTLDSKAMEHDWDLTDWHLHGMITLSSNWENASLGFLRFGSVQRKGLEAKVD